jgi:hypothetical protein
MPEIYTLIKWLTYGQNGFLLQREHMLEIETGFPYGLTPQVREQPELDGVTGSQCFNMSLSAGKVMQMISFGRVRETVSPETLVYLVNPGRFILSFIHITDSKTHTFNALGDQVVDPGVPYLIDCGDLDFCDQARNVLATAETISRNQRCPGSF